MRHLLTIFMSLCLVISQVACGSKTNKNSKNLTNNPLVGDSVELKTDSNQNLAGVNQENDDIHSIIDIDIGIDSITLNSSSPVDEFDDQASTTSDTPIEDLPVARTAKKLPLIEESLTPEETIALKTIVYEEKEKLNTLEGLIRNNPELQNLFNETIKFIGELIAKLNEENPSKLQTQQEVETMKEKVQNTIREIKKSTGFFWIRM